MLAAVAAAALGYPGAKRNYRNALTGPARLRDRQKLCGKRRRGVGPAWRSA